MRALAQVVAEADDRGGTRLTVLRGESPLLVRRTGGRSGPGATVHLVGGAAGPLRGDDLRMEITVGAGAALTVRSVAAQLALPGRPAPPSRLTIHAEVAGTLRWLPEPLIAAAGCDHCTETRVEVAEGGELLWRDDLVCGRHAEPSGDARLETTIRYAGRTLYRHALGVGRHADGWDGPAVLGGGRAVGTVVAVPGFAGSLPASAGAALMPLAGPGVLATAVGPDIRQVRAALDPLCEPVEEARGGNESTLPPWRAEPQAATAIGTP
ncbi:urease accessory protein UreD [Paractinoplanes ferrugineus]|uniref:Urease accessory protein UreD n=1 Tax=Paractinoplanes ferrugineus TaxID=113564 RepID=A0A919MF29_9ACTN|nr:urease accessory protein UreD [Actinoplanes ferrugineus]GIE12319.1 urease accessory protein UreD [Actinoplanes ferrugineus]